MILVYNPYMSHINHKYAPFLVFYSEKGRVYNLFNHVFIVAEGKSVVYNGPKL